MLEDPNNLGWLKCLSCDFKKKGKNSMITIKELLGDVKLEDLPEDYRKNAEELLRRVNLFRKEYGQPMYVTSGYRSPEHNAKIGGSKASAHMSCQAIDFRDGDKKLKEFIAKDPAILEKCDLYMEHPDATLTWIHLQSRPTKSGNRVFKP
jgi:hypothetical protein